MLNKMTDESFNSFGNFYDEPVDLQKNNLSVQKITSNSKKLTQLFVLSSEAFIECPPGTARILITSTPDMDDLQTFPVRRYIHLRPGMHFNLIPLASAITWRLITPHVSCKTVSLPLPYTYQPVSAPFHVRKILDCWFAAYTCSYCLTQEAHRSYELIYIYEGTMELSLSTGTYTLKSHDLLVYRSDGAKIRIESACSFLITVFDVNQRKTLHILNNPFHCTNEIQQILWKLLIESFENTYYTNTLMICYLQEALLLLMQFYDTVNHRILISENNTSRNDLLAEILTYMNSKITEPVTIEDICHEFFISRSSLQALFKTHLNASPKNYLLNIKLQKSKELIRENQYTISEIAYMLGFSSIHYFSRLFKKYFHTTPSDYARKVAENKGIRSDDPTNGTSH